LKTKIPISICDRVIATHEYCTVTTTKEYFCSSQVGATH
jgi:hypothetical protein